MMKYMTKQVARLKTEEEGVAMIVAVLLSSVIATLAILMLSSGLHVDKATARGRHFVQALSVAESGIEQAISRIETAGTAMASTSFTGSTELGAYAVTITQNGRGRLTVESVGGVREGRALGSTRKIKVEMAPASAFDKALFSYTTVETKNNDVIDGGVWANHNVILAQGTIVRGSVVAATGYFYAGAGALVEADATSGGFHATDGRAVHLDGGAEVDGALVAAVTGPCDIDDQSDYKVDLDNGSLVGGSVTTWGTSIAGSGNVTGARNTTTCIPAPAPKPLPSFSFNAANYASVRYFGTPSTSSAMGVNDFQTYIDSVSKRISGTFYVNQSAPLTQSTRLDLTGVVITGDTTIITNTPIFGNGTTDDTTDAVFSMVSTYQPPAGTSCDVNQDNSQCAIHLKNNFKTTGQTAVLVYAPNGPVAIKNNQEQFGAIYGDSIQIKNNQMMTYDARVDRVVGFGDVGLAQVSWKEVRV